MNETIHYDSASDASWPTSDGRMRVPDTSMLPDSEKAAPAAVGLLTQAVQGTHDTIDRLAGSATLAVRELGDRVSGADDAPHAKTDQLRDTQDGWVQKMRTAAVTLGSMTARITIEDRALASQ